MSVSLEDVLRWSVAQLPRITDEVCAEVVAQLGFYAADEVVPRRDLHRSVEVNLRYILGSLAEPGVTHDPTAPTETGRRRARQGAPLPEVLRVYRVAGVKLWEALVARAREVADPPVRDELLDVATRLWRLGEEQAVLVTEAYREETAEMVRREQRRHSALVEALFTGESVRGTSPWEVGKLLDLPLDGQFEVVVADTHGVAQESLAGVEKQLAAAGCVSAWQLTPAVHRGVVCVRDEGHRTRVVDVLQGVGRVRIGISPPYSSLQDTPRSLHLAATAMQSVPPDRPQVRTFSPSPVSALVATDPGEARRAARTVLGPVLALPADDRDSLLDTLESALLHDGNADRAADSLHCHANTVRYRLRRVKELTGRSLADPLGAADLAVAVEAARLFRGAGGP